MNIKLSLKRALAEADRDRAWLCKQLGVYPQQLSRWVSSQHLSTAIIERIAGQFGMTILEFLELGERDSIYAAGVACCSDEAELQDGAQAKDYK